MKQFSEFKTVGDLHDLVAMNLSAGVPHLKGHATYVMQAREFGSTTEIGLDQVPREIPLEPVLKHPSVSCMCICYKFQYPMGGVIGAIPFSEAIKHGPVFVREGKHGTELYMVGDADTVANHNPDDIYAIIGWESGIEALFTWHPGEPLGTIDDGIWHDTGVKVDR